MQGVSMCGLKQDEDGDVGDEFCELEVNAQTTRLVHVATPLTPTTNIDAHILRAYSQQQVSTT